MIRVDGRKPDEIRPLVFSPDFVKYPEGSVMIRMGDTRVLCNVTVTAEVPRWMQTQGILGGWVTAEYAMLPRSTAVRSPRETRGLGGRTQEIRRMIGRSLRASVDLTKLGHHTLVVDCDVIQADGGTRTAAISGGYTALRLALQKMVVEGELSEEVFLPPVAAISVGVVDDQPMVDLNYHEDSRADIDVNVVMNQAGEFIEIQGTAEKAPFSRNRLDILLDLAESGILQVLEAQNEVYQKKNR